MLPDSLININVLVVDDHPAIRAGIRAILIADGFRGQLGEATDADTAVSLACRGEWDVVLLDFYVPGLSGLQVLAQILARQPGQRVIILGMYTSPVYIGRALKAGAAGFLSKDTAAEELVGALQAVIEGQTYSGGNYSALP